MHLNQISILFLDPTKEGEALRRKIFEDIKDISYYFDANIDMPDTPNLKKNFKLRVKYATFLTP